MTNTLKRPGQSLALSNETAFIIRGLDLIASGIGSLLLIPIFLLIGLVVKFTSAGPVFHIGKRVGQNGQIFNLYKFRSMYMEGAQRGPALTLKDDPRITPIGRFLRRTKLDELPQLFNVLQGEMSLVGPRPEDPVYVAFYTPWQRQVLAVKPGITSLASLYYREEETLLSGDNWETFYREQILPHKLAVDLAYLQRRTVWTDIILILQTIAFLFRGAECVNVILQLRNRHIFLLDIFLLFFSPALALSLRLDRADGWLLLENHPLIFYTLFALLVKLTIFYQLDLYNCYWRYAGVNDLMRILLAAGLSTVILTLLFWEAYPALDNYGLAMYRTVPMIDGLLTLLAVSGPRFGLRGLYHWRRQYGSLVGGRRVLIVGAGEAGALIVREMRANPKLDMEPIAFVDDDPLKIGTRIHGLTVLGASNNISDIVNQYQIQRIIVAVPSAPLPRQREIIARCEQTGVTTHSLPGIYEILAGHKAINGLPQLDLNRFLRREPVKIDESEISTMLRGAIVLVTGAGGSIGSELCRQIARFNPAKLILLGHGENSIFEVELDLRLTFPDVITQPVIVDIRDQQRVNWVVEKYRPQFIFHAAAHKHVPFMEDNVQEAVTNNILGTRNVLQAAEHYGVGRFVLISTDKAINPTSIMGATKRMAELLVVAAARRTGRPYVAVRFGNVLGSRGSVIRVFQRQIIAGGPLTLTHRDMCRYFMTIPEAAQLVLQSAVLGRGSEIFMLDMGAPVRIIDLAQELLKLYGLEPERDINIIFTGIRPGEKLNEELILTGENYQQTKQPKILAVAHESAIGGEVLEHVIIELINLSSQIQTPSAAEQMRGLIPRVCYYIDGYSARPRLSLPEPTAPSLSPSPGLLYPRSSTSAA